MTTNSDTKSDTVPDIDDLHSEFQRVFGSLILEDDGSIRAEDWPDSWSYDAVIAVPVLRQFADHHGETEHGDAEACRALDRAQARC